MEKPHIEYEVDFCKTFQFSKILSLFLKEFLVWIGFSSFKVQSFPFLDLLVFLVKIFDLFLLRYITLAPLDSFWTFFSFFPIYEYFFLFLSASTSLKILLFLLFLFLFFHNLVKLEQFYSSGTILFFWNNFILLE